MDMKYSTLSTVRTNGKNKKRSHFTISGSPKVAAKDQNDLAGYI